MRKDEFRCGMSEALIKSLSLQFRVISGENRAFWARISGENGRQLPFFVDHENGPGHNLLNGLRIVSCGRKSLSSKEKRPREKSDARLPGTFSQKNHFRPLTIP